MFDELLLTWLNLFFILIILVVCFSFYVNYVFIIMAIALTLSI